MSTPLNSGATMPLDDGWPPLLHRSQRFRSGSATIEVKMDNCISSRLGSAHGNQQGLLVSLTPKRHRLVLTSEVLGATKIKCSTRQIMLWECQTPTTLLGYSKTSRADVVRPDIAEHIAHDCIVSNSKHAVNDRTWYYRRSSFSDEGETGHPRRLTVLS